MKMLLLLLTFVLVPVFALAQAVDPGTDPGAFLSALLLAAKGGQWIVVGILATIGIVFLARKFGAKYVPFLGTRRGGALLLLISSVVTALATPILAGTPITLSVLLHVLVTGIGAAGGRTIFRTMLTGGTAADAQPKPTVPTGA